MGGGDDEALARMRAELHAMAERLEALAAASGDEPVDTAEHIHEHRHPPPDDYTPLLRSLYAERRARDEIFAGAHLIAEPAWDILLDLLVQADKGKSVSVTSACTASCVPPTTALRWIDILLKQGLIERHADPIDKRRSFVRLSETGHAKMRKVAEAMAEARRRHLR